ncbi:exodeoxyribonuclease V subunit gamma [Nocardioides yefusunii]|uniref:RecBCD enzyme subunit RecC n=1 Tax=Nocardioides yefusunii TaxID=2500546 RepID=A0ABW1QZV0_9ACTN|nr:exodeoxyribonuclease V subunit gamma [Nocardioides yefusunii]
MPLTLHHAHRTDLLADELAGLLATPLPDPFAQEVVVVPAKGIERWLTQRLSHWLGAGPRGGDGVCAGVRFVAPHSLVGLLLDRDRDDPWRADNLTWPLLDAIDASLDEPAFAQLARHLGQSPHPRAGDEARRARRFSVARHLAGLYSSYALQRPTLLTDWREGRDTDGAGHALDPDLVWQAELWRRVLGRVDATPPDVRHTETLARLRAGGDTLDLPARLSFFGHTRLARTEIELLQALAEHREVHLWLPLPSTELWEALSPTAVAGPVARSEDASARLVRHPLLASLGRDTRELRRQLGDLPAVAAATEPTTPSTLLGWLQHDLRHDVRPDAALRGTRPLSPTDRSVQVHACHGPARQVEVLRDALVGLLADDPTLEPRDILVMCPDVETYAPLIQAAFGLGDVEEGAGHPGHRLRVRLADRALGSTNPLLGFAAAVVELSGSRMGVTEVLDLAASAPVRARFGFSDEQLERVTDWVRSSGVRWGRDPAHRAEFGLELPDNTWLAGLRRMLLGAAVSGGTTRVVGNTLPLDDVGDGDLDLLGRFAEFLQRLHTFTVRARSAATVTDWTGALREAVAGLTLVSGDDAWQRSQFDREMEQIAAGPGAAATRLRHADVRALLAHRLRGRPTRANFRTGTLTVCTLVPMRSVPHRVIALLGLDDGVFPRVNGVDGDDVLSRHPLTGERDVRAEDRQLLLDAVNAATETLVVTYSGRGEHTGSDKPPSVPLGELVDALHLTADVPHGRDLVVEHPLQPFDEKNMTAGLVSPSAPFTFDEQALAGASAARNATPHVRELLRTPLPAPTAEPSNGPRVVLLSELHEFLRHPVQAFLRQRLRVSTPRDVKDTHDALPVSLDGLEKWAIGDRLVGALLRGESPFDAAVAERLRGSLPPGALGTTTLREIGRAVEALVGAAAPLRQRRARTIDVDIDLGDVRVVGSVAEVFGNHRVSVSYSGLGAKQRLAGWVDALALAAGAPDQNWTVHSIGKYRSGGKSAMVKPISEPDARTLLRSLVGLRDRGLREPLPLPLKTSLAWAENHAHVLRGRDADPDEWAWKEWATPTFSDSGFPKEDADAAHVRVWGERAPYRVLTAPLRPDELAALAPGADGVVQQAPHRLGQYAWALWGPLLSNDRELVRGA